VNVPGKWKPFIRSKVKSGDYRSEDEVFDEALCLLKQRDSEQCSEKT
jgi:Arc/MetJ-type ribon-helix-helix transcriptional regulator